MNQAARRDQRFAKDKKSERAAAGFDTRPTGAQPTQPPGPYRDRRSASYRAGTPQERLERRLQTFAFVGAALLLGAVLVVSCIVQSSQRDREQAGLPPTRHPTSRPTGQPRTPLPTTASTDTSRADSTPRPSMTSWRLLLEETEGALDPLYSSAESSLLPVLFLGTTMSGGPDAAEERPAGPLPVLVESWESAENVYTLHLRRDVSWIRCEPFTGVAERMRPVEAADVVYAVERALGSEAPLYRLTPLYTLAGARIRHQGNLQAPLGLEAVDTFTLRITLSEPIYPEGVLPDFLSHPVAWPLPAEPIEKHGASWIEPGHIWTSGSYCPIAWVPGQSVALTSNPFLPEDLWVSLEENALLPRPTPSLEDYPRPPETSGGIYPEPGP